MTSRYHELTAVLQALNLRQMATGFAAMAVRSVREERSHEAYVYELAKRELQERTTQRQLRRTRESGLPLGKTFTTLHLPTFGPRVTQQVVGVRHSTWIADARNVIAVGAPGTGKSHLAAALGHELIQQGHTVYWSSTATLVQRLLVAKRDLALPQALAKLDRFACLILDAIGYVQHERDEMEVLFTLYQSAF